MLDPRDNRGSLSARRESRRHSFGRMRGRQGRVSLAKYPASRCGPFGSSVTKKGGPAGPPYWRSIRMDQKLMATPSEILSPSTPVR